MVVSVVVSLLKTLTVEDRHVICQKPLAHWQLQHEISDLVYTAASGVAAADCVDYWITLRASNHLKVTQTHSWWQFYDGCYCLRNGMNTPSTTLHCSLMTSTSAAAAWSNSAQANHSRNAALNRSMRLFKLLNCCVVRIITPCRRH